MLRYGNFRGNNDNNDNNDNRQTDRLLYPCAHVWAKIRTIVIAKLYRPQAVPLINK